MSIIWGYPSYMHGFAPYESHYLHVLDVAKAMGFQPCAIVCGGSDTMQKDPHFDPDIKIIEYKNILHFLFQIIRLSLRNSVFYVNSYEWQSFLVPFLARRTIFMAHTQPRRQTKFRQHIQNFVYKFFTAIRLNNETERQFCIEQGTLPQKLFVAPLVISQDVFKLINTAPPPHRDIVYFGNITAKKNLPTILRAFEMAKKTLPDLRFHIIGNMRDEHTALLIKKSPYQKDIILYGFLPAEKAAPELNKCLIYVNSSFDEGMCVAVYDAALCGCVLCLPDTMSFSGVFKDAALFHQQNDYAQLAKNILTYLNDPQLVEKHRNSAIEMISKNYSLVVVEEQMKQLFSAV